VIEGYDQYRTPIVLVRVDGAVSADLSARIIEMKYNDNHKMSGKGKGSRKGKKGGGAHVDKLDLHISDPQHEFTGDPRFAPDARWDVRWGYPNELSEIRWFLLKYYEPIYDHTGIHSKKLTLYGTAHTLTTVKGARNWGRISSSEIANQIAKRHGLRVDIEFTDDQNETAFIQPVDQSDFEFLSELADDIDFLFYVENDVLTYKSRDTAYSESPRQRFVYGGPGSILLSFKPVVKATADVVVGAKAVDTKTGQAVQPKVDSSNVGGVHLGADVVKSINDSSRTLSAIKPGAGGNKITSGADLTKKMDQLKRDHDVPNLQSSLTTTKTVTQIDLETGTRKVVVVPDSTSAALKTPETNAAKIAAMAKAVKRDFLADSVQATAEWVGVPSIRAKSTHNFVLPDPKFSGQWYCEETTHHISDKAYKVTAKLHRGAFTDKSAAKKVDNNRTTLNKKEQSKPPIPTVGIDLESGRVTRPTASIPNKLITGQQ